MGNRLAELRQKKNWTQDQAASAFGLSKSGYVKLERGERRLSDGYIQIAAKVYGVTPAEILGGAHEIPLVGHIGAGQEIHAEFDDAPFDHVEAPPGVSPKTTVAVEVRGDSMYPLLDEHDLVYYSRRDEAPERMVGRLCVVRLADGRTFVKRLRRGTAPGLYMLESLNGPPIEDVEIEWVARIDWMKPRDGDD